MPKRLARGVATVWLLITCLSTNGEASSNEEGTSSIDGYAINIGTGSPTGVYYPAGGAICAMLDLDQQPYDIHCQAKSTGGSKYNLENLNEGKLQIGIAQADTLYQAWNGHKPFKKKGINLRVLFSLHEEMVTLAVHRDAEIISFKRIQGRRLNVGPESSGNAQVVSELFKACKIFPGDLGLIGRLNPTEVSQAMHSRLMDGFFYVIGHPNESLAHAANSMPLSIIPLDGECIKKLTQDKERPYFDATVIPGGLYRGVDLDIATFGVKAWVVTSTNTPDKIAHQVVKSVFENLEKFRRKNPAFYRLSPRKMIKRNDVPYHQGALDYYGEKGWYRED